MSKCKSLSKLYEEMGRPMTFKEFATTFNEGGQSVEYLVQKIEEKRSAIKYSTPPKPSNKELEDIAKNNTVCKESSFGILQILALTVIVGGSIYLLTKKSN